MLSQLVSLQRLPGLAVISLALLLGSSRAADAQTDLVPSGKGWAVHAAPGGALPDAAPNATVTTGNGIGYHNGPIMPGTVKFYFIWYGNWVNGRHTSDSPGTVALLQQLFAPNVLGGSGYAMINSTYGDQTHNVSGNFYLAAAAADLYSFGPRLTDLNVKSIVANAISSKALPFDPAGLYFVLTSSDVAETSGFCHSYCGFHDHTHILGKDIKFVYAGNSDRCPGACEAQTISPNGNSGADAMASVLAHESEEAITDPDLNAWFRNTTAGENADLCNFKYGPTVGAIGKGAYNQTLGGLHWLIQMNWENANGGGCAQTLGGPFYTK